MTSVLIEPDLAGPPEDPFEPVQVGPVELFDQGAEQVVLGSMMLSPHVIPDVARLLRAEDFYRPQHGIVFDAILALEAHQEIPDAFRVTTYLAERNLLQRVGGAPRLHDLIACVPTSAMAESHAQTVAQCAILRRLSAAGDRIRQIALSSQREGAAVALDRARVLLAEIDAPSLEEGPVPWSEILPAALKAIEADGEGLTPKDAIPTGFTDLDRLLGGGAHPGEFLIIAGRPGTGKTVSSLDIARSVAFHRNHDRHPVLVFSLEMSQNEIARRIIAAEARVPHDNVKTGQLSDDDWCRIARAAGETADGPLEIDVSPNLTLADIRARALRWRKRHNQRGVVIVDYVQLVGSPKGGGREEQRERLEILSRGLKLLAKELDCPVYGVCQLNRGPEQRTDKIPTLADLKGSGAWEQDANVVIFVHRDDYYDKESPRAGEADFMVLKNRGGPTDTVTVAAQLHLSRFVDMAVL